MILGFKKGKFKLWNDDEYYFDKQDKEGHISDSINKDRVPGEFEKEIFFKKTGEDQIIQTRT